MLNAEGTGYVMALPVPGIRHADADQHGGGAQHRLGAAARRRPDGGDRARRSPSPTSSSHIEPLARGVAAGRGALSPLHLRGRRARAVRQRQRPGRLHRAVERAPLPRPAARGGRGARASPRATATRRWATLPSELRLTGGAARSRVAARRCSAAAVQAPVRVSSREEAGAAGAAMMAAVAIGAYPTMDACIASWVTPLLGPAEAPDPELVAHLRPRCSRPTSAPAARWRRSGTRWPARDADADNRTDRRGDRGIRKEHGMTETGHDRPSGHRRRHQRRRDRARRGRPRPVGDPLREGRPRRGLLVALGQAGARRPALSRILRVPPGARGADRARGAAERRPATSSGRCASCCRTARRTGRPGWCGSASSSTTISAAARSCRARARSTCAAIPRARRSSTSTPAASNIPTAGSTTRGSWC